MLLLIDCSCCVLFFRSAALKHEQASPLELPGSWAVQRSCCSCSQGRTWQRTQKEFLRTPWIKNMYFSGGVSSEEKHLLPYLTEVSKTVTSKPGLFFEDILWSCVSFVNFFHLMSAMPCPLSHCVLNCYLLSPKFTAVTLEVKRKTQVCAFDSAAFV